MRFPDFSGNSDSAVMQTPITLFQVLRNFFGVNLFSVDFLAPLPPLEPLPSTQRVSMRNHTDNQLAGIGRFSGMPAQQLGTL